jgi:hypothetical protein
MSMYGARVELTNPMLELVKTFRVLDQTAALIGAEYY